MSNQIVENLIQEFALKQYADVALDDLGGRYVGEKLSVWVNPVQYTDCISGFAPTTLESSRWVVATLYENPDGTKVFTASQVKQMPDPMVVYLADKAVERYAAYQKKFPDLSNNSRAVAAT